MRRRLATMTIAMALLATVAAPAWAGAGYVDDEGYDYAGAIAVFQGPALFEGTSCSEPVTIYRVVLVRPGEPRGHAAASNVRGGSWQVLIGIPGDEVPPGTRLDVNGQEPCSDGTLILNMSVNEPGAGS